MNTGKPNTDTGVLLLNMGGPDRIEAIGPFLQNLFSDREIIRFPVPAAVQRLLARSIARTRARKLAPVYRAMGGCSPQVTLTLKQAGRLEEALAEQGIPARVYVGMRYWKPFIRTSVEKMVADGITRAVVLPLYPQFSTATTGSSLGELARVASALGPEIAWLTVRSWETHPLYVSVLAELVRERLRRMPEGEEPALLFSAHSLPKRFVDRGDPYPGQVAETVRAVLADLQWHGVSRLAYQSRVGPVRWLRPTTAETLEELARAGHRRVVVAPVSFVSDHIETLQELDKEYRAVATSLGFTHFERAEAPNVRPRFIAALAAIVASELHEPARAARSRR